MGFFTTAPLEQDLDVEISVADESVVSVPNNAVVIPAGESELFVPVTGGSCGVPESVLERLLPNNVDPDDVSCGTKLTARSAQAEISVVVALGPAVEPGRSFEITAPPVGAVVRPLPTLGQVVLAPGSSGTVSVGLLTEASNGDTTFSVTTSNSNVAEVQGDVTIPDGATDASLTINTQAAGEAVLTLRAGNDAGSLRVVVGVPEPGATAPVLAAPVGLCVGDDCAPDPDDGGPESD